MEIVAFETADALESLALFLDLHLRRGLGGVAWMRGEMMRKADDALRLACAMLLVHRDMVVDGSRRCCGDAAGSLGAREGIRSSSVISLPARDSPIPHSPHIARPPLTFKSAS